MTLQTTQEISSTDSILLVDDHSSMVTLMTQALQSTGVKLYSAESGAEAIEQAKIIKPSLILLDIMLPDLDGTLVFRIIRSDPDIPYCPVIFLSGASDIAAKIGAFAQTGIDFIGKPCKPEELRIRVQIQLNIFHSNKNLEKQNTRLERELKTQRGQLARMERVFTIAEMAAGFAHEIKQPLTAITNFSSAATNGLKNNIGIDKISDYIRQINSQAERASQVINKLRSFIGKPEVSAEKIDVSMLIFETLNFVSNEIETNHIDVINQVESIQKTIVGDKIQLQQVLINIIKNSIDAMARTDETNQIEIHFTDSYLPGFNTIIISDNGCGITSEMQKTLFHPFQTSKSSGMGIGLTICETIMHAHGGTITFESQPGLTCFYINLPSVN